MDIGRLIQETDAETVAEYLQMDIERKGKSNYILCPGHVERLGKPDFHFGNAVLKRHGYECYACHEFVNTHDMVMEVTGCSSEEAYNIMAAAMGFEPCGPDMNQDEALPRLKLMRQEAEVIGLYPRFREIAVQKSNKNGVIVIHDGLFTLYKQNPDLYYKIIVNKAAESCDRYRYCKQHYASVNSDMAYVLYDLLGEKFDNSIYASMDRELNDRIKICQKIINIFSKP